MNNGSDIPTQVSPSDLHDTPVRLELSLDVHTWRRWGSERVVTGPRGSACSQQSLLWTWLGWLLVPMPFAPPEWGLSSVAESSISLHPSWAKREQKRKGWDTLKTSKRRLWIQWRGRGRGNLAIQRFVGGDGPGLKPCLSQYFPHCDSYMALEE